MSLTPLSYDQWTCLSSKCLILMKRLRLLSMNHPYSEFLQCLLVQFLLSHTESLPQQTILQGASHGLKSSEVCRDIQSETPIDMDLTREKEEATICTEMIDNETPRMKCLYELLEHSFRIPSTFQRKWGELAGLFCRTCFTYCCHHLSIISLFLLFLLLTIRVDSFATYLLSAPAPLTSPLILTILWKHVIFSFCSTATDPQDKATVSTIERIRILTLYTATQFDLGATTRPSTSLSLDLDETPRVVFDIEVSLLECSSTHSDALHITSIFCNGRIQGAF